MLVPIATETETNTATDNCYEYAVTYDGRNARELGHPDRPYTIVMRVKRADNSCSDWGGACMGWYESENQAIEGFTNRVDPGRFILAFCHPEAETSYAARVARQAAREAADEAFGRFIGGIQEAAETAENERKRAIAEAMEAARPKFKRMLVRLAIDRIKFPEKPDTVSAWVYRGLAIHQPPSAYARASLYHISHVASGKAVSRNGLTLKDARLRVWRLSQLADWTRDEATVLKTLNDKKAEEQALALIGDPYAAL
jgi:hypothetical protein